MSYLGNLTLRLSAGATRLPRQDRRLHGAFLAAGQNDDGGFSGRRGPSDLYYTGFIGNIVMFLVGFGASFMLRPTARSLVNLTVWRQDQTPVE